VNVLVELAQLGGAGGGGGIAIVELGVVVAGGRRVRGGPIDDVNETIYGGPAGKIACLEVAIVDAHVAANSVVAGGGLSLRNRAGVSTRAAVVWIQIRIDADSIAECGAGDADKAAHAIGAGGHGELIRFGTSVTTNATVVRVLLEIDAAYPAIGAGAA